MSSFYRSSGLLLGTAMVLLILLFPSVALSQECVRWDLSGHFTIRQSNGITVGFTLSQSGGSLRGSASFGSVTGNVSGQFSAVDEFQMTVRWSGSSVGVYTGSI